MNKIISYFLFIGVMTCTTQTTATVYADGDLAPLGTPDGLLNSADYLIGTRIVTNDLTATNLELSHGDLYPPNSPDGIFNIQDLLLLQKLVLSDTANKVVTNLDLFNDGPATVTTNAGFNSSTTTMVTDGYTGPGATVTNNAYFTDPDDASNTVWYVDISGGTANVFLNTGDLSADPVVDTGFDFSGNGNGFLVFDIKVNSIAAGTNLTVKVDSGYPQLGKYTLTPSDYSVGSWQRVSINFATLLANPGPGTGLDLANVANAFVIEVTNGSASFYLDNIFITRDCPDTTDCNATINTKAIYSLVWSDEFDGTSLSTDNWAPETGYGGSFGWGNDEWQLYTGSSNNIDVSNGNLTISAQCANPPSCGKRDGTITSARINTLNKFAFKYGKVEARLKPPVGKGTWPAFWMLGKNFPAVGWPQTGEVDIMEMNNRYSDANTTHFTVHYCDDAQSSPCVYDPGWQYDSQYRSFPYSLGDDYHVFSAEWNEAGITGKIDGIPYFYKAINPATMDEFLAEFFMILNVAIGGTLGGAPDATTVWPQTMVVDYVRVYQADEDQGSYTIGSGPISPELGLYSESHTESELSYLRIVNSADWGGNYTGTNKFSTAVTAYDGNRVMAAEFIDYGNGYGGFIFDFNIGQDISSYQAIKFAIDSSQMASFNRLEIKPEDSDAGSEQGLPISNYTPTIAGNWAVYEIPLADFVNFDPTSMILLGFWNPKTAGGQLTFGTLYFDDIHFSGGM